MKKPSSHQEVKITQFDVKLIVVGTSWGGLDALSCLLSPLPKNYPIPILIVQHRQRNHHGSTYLAEILNQRCQLNIIEPDDKERIKAGNVYISPSNYHMLVEDKETLALSSEELVNYSRPSIDLLFESAAEIHQQNLIGIILTGANKDGAKGLATIKDRGGYGLVQSPETAEVDTMPLAAISSAQPDAVLPLNEITSLLLKIPHQLNSSEHSSKSYKNT